MEAEGQENTNTTPSKRFKLKTLVQSSFGAPENPDYVFDIASSWDNTVMVVSLSTNALKLYNPMTGQLVGDCLGHTNTISDILFPDPRTPQIFCSSSSDGTVRVWDTRTRQQVKMFRSHETPEIFSISFGGASNDLIAAGGKEKILFWDWRSGKQTACIEECHMEDVTQVRFHPTRRDRLVSASVDGLICVINTLGEINDDDGLDMVMGVGTSVGRIGFFGSSNEKLWCLTHIETLSLWDFEEGAMLADFNETRAKASANWTLEPVDYLVDCYHSAPTERLWLLAGNNSGSLGYFPISYSSNSANTSANAGVLGPVSAVLEGGHSGVVRTVWSPSSQGDGSASIPGLFCWTGGEDGRLCSWSEGNHDVDKGRGWVSKSLVMKKSNRQKLRSKPY